MPLKTTDRGNGCNRLDPCIHFRLRSSTFMMSDENPRMSTESDPSEMAPPAPRPTGEAAACCSPAVQQACCEPGARSTCCAEPASGTCGCQ
jgi:hypothetical protein